jgi:hypothetical protein
MLLSTYSRMFSAMINMENYGTLLSTPAQADFGELVVLETRGKTFPITSAYKWSIYIFQAWYRELLLKDK